MAEPQAPTITRPDRTKISSQEVSLRQSKPGEALSWREQRKPLEFFINNRSQALGYDESKPPVLVPIKANHTTPPLLRLPFEIRLRILEAAVKWPQPSISVSTELKWNLKSRRSVILGATTKYVGAGRSRATLAVLTAQRLAQTCSQLYFEVIVDANIFYACNTLRFATPLIFHAWAESASRETLARLQHVVIDGPDKAWGTESRHLEAFTLLANSCTGLRSLQLCFAISDPTEDSTPNFPLRAEHLWPLLKMRGLRHFEMKPIPNTSRGGWAPPFSVWNPNGTWKEILKPEGVDADAGQESPDLDEVVHRFGMSPKEFQVAADAIKEEVLKPRA